MKASSFLVSILDTWEYMDLVLWFGGVMLPWAIGWAVILALIWTWYWDHWVFKGMDEQKRYRYLKIRKW